MADESLVPPGAGRLLLMVPTAISYRVFLRELAWAACDQGWETHVATSLQAGCSNPLQDGPVALHHLAIPRGLDFWGQVKAARKLRRLVDTLQPDIVSAHFSAAILTLALARSHHRPVCLGTVQGLGFPLSHFPKRILLRAAEAFALARMDRAWVLTRDDLEAIGQYLPHGKVHLQRAPGFGVARKRFDPANTSVAALPMNWRGESDAVTLIFIGRLVAFKGFGQLVRVILKLHLQHPQLRLIVVGERDRLHPDGLTPDEREQAAHHARIHFTGHVEDVAPWLAAADVMVFPSSREGMPVSVMEALSMGVPVIVRDTRGCRELIEHGRNGIHLRDASDEALRAAILEMAARIDHWRFMQPRIAAEAARLDRSLFIGESLAVYNEALVGFGD